MNEPKEPIRNRIKNYIANNQVNERVKTHFEKNKIKYYVGATVVATTVVNVTVFALLRKNQEKATTSIASANNGGHHNTITNINHLNIFYKRVSKYGVPLGRPGTAVVNVETGQMYDTIQRCAHDLDVTTYELGKLLDGKIPDIDGYVIKRATEFYKEEIQALADQITARREEQGY